MKKHLITLFIKILKAIGGVFLYFAGVFWVSAFTASAISYLYLQFHLEKFISTHNNLGPIWRTNTSILLIIFVISLGALSASFVRKIIYRLINTIPISPNNIVINILSFLLITAFLLNFSIPNLYPSLNKSLGGFNIYAAIFLISLCVGTLLNYLFDFLSRTLKEEKKVSTKIFLNEDLTDDPITEEAEDILGRIPFIEGFYEQIISLPFNSSFVFSLQGGWGEGKTSVINLLEKKLLSDKKFLTLRFDPWFFNDTKVLLESFFREFELSINSHYFFPSFRKTIHKYRKLMLAPLKNGVPFDASALEVFMENESIIDVKERLDKILNKIDKKIVIFIDDIDRLQKDEIIQVFRMVKLVNNFRNTIFVLSFDETVIEDVVVPGRSSDRYFMEKIVQKIIPLPKPDQLDIDEYLDKYLDLLMTNIKIPDKEKKWVEENFSALYQASLRRHFTTLRKVKRYINSLRATLSYSVKEEVNILDVYAMEFIRVFYPKIFEDIWENKWYYTFYEWDNELLMESPLRFVFKDEEVNKVIKAHFNDLIKDLLSGEKQTLTEVISEVFPQIDRALARPNYDHSNLSGKSRAEKRISHPVIFRRYFMLKDRKNELSDSEVRALISLLNTIDFDKIIPSFKKALKSYDQNGKFLDLINRIDTFHQDIEAERVGAFIKALYFYVNEMPRSRQDPKGDSEFNQIFTVIYRLINNRVSKENVEKVLEDLVKNGPLFYSVRAVNWATSNEQGFYNIKENSDQDKLKKLVTTRLRKTFIKTREDIFIRNPEIGGFVLKSWAYYGDKAKKEVNGYVFKLLKKHPGYVTRIVDGFVVHWNNEDIAQIDYNDLSSVYDVNKLYSVIDKLDVKKIKTTREKKAVSLFRKVYLDSKSSAIDKK